MKTNAHNFLIGIDGGGTGCRVAIAAEDLSVLALGEAGPANVFSDFDGAITNIRSSIAQAQQRADLDETALHAARWHLGLAGVISPDIAQKVCAAFAYPNLSVSDDRPTTLSGALGGQDGSVAAIGTGSFIGRLSQGECHFAGGWGLKVSDQASGGWLGRRLLEEVLLYVDGLSATSPLCQDILARFENDPNGIVAFAQTASPSDFASLAPPLVSHHQSGDPLAGQILQEGLRYIQKALKAVGYQPEEPICFTGGLGRVYAALVPKSEATHIVAPQESSLLGALRLAKAQKCP